MIDLMKQINGLFNAAIDRAEPKNFPSPPLPVARVPGDGNIKSLRPTTATPSLAEPPVANVGDGKQN